MGLLSKIGDWLGVDETVVVRGQFHSRSRMREQLEAHRIEVKFIRAYAPWNGGQIWERDTYIRVKRGQGTRAAVILAGYGYEVLNYQWEDAFA